MQFPGSRRRRLEVFDAVRRLRPQPVELSLFGGDLL
jgi:hypothetical protein